MSGGRPAELGGHRSGEQGRGQSTGLAEIAAGTVRGAELGTGPGSWPSVVPGWAAPGPCGAGERLRSGRGGPGCPGRAAPGVPLSGAGLPGAARELGRSCAGPVGRVPGASPVGSWAALAVPAPSQRCGSEFGSRCSALLCEAVTPAPAPPGAAAGRARPWHGAGPVLRGSYTNRAAPCPESHLGTPRAALQATKDRLHIFGAALCPPPGM